MEEEDLEKEIQAKGLTAPRISPADIEANIVSESYFTAADGVRGASVGKPGESLIPEYVTYEGLAAVPADLLRPRSAQRLHRHRRIRLRQPRELRHRDWTQNRMGECGGEGVAADGLRAAEQAGCRLTPEITGKP